MFLGVVLHGGLFFMKGAGAAAWPAREASTSGFFNLLVGWIHLFRMPAFFLLGGFFGALLWRRYGAGGFLRHRARRLLLPLAAAWVVLAPVVGLLLSTIGGNRGGEGTAAAGVGMLLRRANLMHLWFLWYLFLLCLGAWGLLLGLRHLPEGWRQRLAAALEAGLTARYNLVLLVLVTAVTLRPMQTAAIATGTSLWPRWSILLAYAVFFAVGWIWQRQERYLATLSDGWRGRLLAGVLLGVASTIFSFGTIATRSRPSFALLLVTAAACWWMILGLIGLFQRYCSQPKTYGRYLADASYWVYLVHIPVLLVLALAFRAWAAPIGLKYLTLVSVATAVCLATYHVLVQGTFVGTFLTGARTGREAAGPRVE